MEATGTGTAIMLVAAAVLWFLYLLPTWVRKHRYTTERTAERVELALQAIQAREELRARQEAEAAYAAARRRAAVEAAATARSPHVDRQAELRRRIRRGRMLASLLLLAATATGLVQVWLISSTGPSFGGWLVLAASVAGVSVAVAAQRRLDRRAASLRFAPSELARVRVSRPAPAVERETPIAWTPVPLPPPLARGPRQGIRPSIDAERLKREAEAAAAAASRPEPRLVPFPERPARPPAERPAAASRFAAMGIVDPSAVAAPDIDAALRKRRSAAG